MKCNDFRSGAVINATSNGTGKLQNASCCAAPTLVVDSDQARDAGKLNSGTGDQFGLEVREVFQHGTLMKMIITIFKDV